MRRSVPLLAFAAAAAFAAAVPAGAATFRTLDGAAPKVIAHRGASAYLPEHTLAAYELGIAMGADLVEPDLQLTADGAVVAMHDGTLERTTNVEALFAPRNGGYAVSDFTLAEIRTLTVEPTGPASTTFPGFTPSMANPFRVPTFEEVLDLVTAHNAVSGDRIGVYPESKTPNRPELNEKIVAAMAAKGFDDRDDNSYIQTFSFAGAAEIAALQQAAGIDNAVVALGVAFKLGDAFAFYDTTTGTATPLDELAGFADGLGAFINGAAFGLRDPDAEFIAAAHALGLEVHGWTFRPTTAEAARSQFGAAVAAGMDGFFTDYPDFGRLVVDEVAAIPLPAAGWLLLGGVGALAALRRRA